ncbi:Deoxyribose-phosphate aldolase [Candidatus Sulfotelmatomonas gaucii]|uniref:Deoxyribose-phosphate aldolase n=1 Tax=Candidatus Sulfuritelmatomonas gaucii TaxID=2043161 RepID=A0A2N9LH87_9BACT|nr:Deoxyribose-phosphate aldolase [Candidatus Sulfotelmatomonas gaucii]
MSTIIAIQDSDLDFDYGTFDSAGFTKKTLANPQALAAAIDHTLLKPDTTRQQVEALCAEAEHYCFACVLVNPIWTSTAVAALTGTGIPTGSVIGYPFGASLVSTLRQEAAALIRLGARELDMVLPVGLLKSGDHQAVQRHIHSVVNVAHHHGALLKVTLETNLLTMEEKLRAAEVAIQAGADFIKTSTGFASSGAAAADVALLRGVAGARCGIKASGGIRTLDQVRAMLEGGANRIGSSAAVAIVQELAAE